MHAWTHTGRIRELAGRTKLYADIAHPINSACRDAIQERVITEFEAELERADSPGYASRYDDSYDASESPNVHPQSTGDEDPRIRIQDPEPGPRPPHHHPATPDCQKTKDANGGEFRAGIF